MAVKQESRRALSEALGVDPERMRPCGEALLSVGPPHSSSSEREVGSGADVRQGEYPALKCLERLLLWNDDTSSGPSVEGSSSSDAQCGGVGEGDMAVKGGKAVGSQASRPRGETRQVRAGWPPP